MLTKIFEDKMHITTWNYIICAVEDLQIHEECNFVALKKKACSVSGLALYNASCAGCLYCNDVCRLCPYDVPYNTTIGGCLDGMYFSLVNEFNKVVTSEKDFYEKKITCIEKAKQIRDVNIKPHVIKRSELTVMQPLVYNSRHLVQGLYRHFKGNIYEVLGVAQDASTEERKVVYRSTVDRPSKLYCRSLEEFLSPVDTVKYPDAEQKFRFELAYNF